MDPENQELKETDQERIKNSRNQRNQKYFYEFYQEHQENQSRTKIRIVFKEDKQFEHNTK